MQNDRPKNQSLLYRTTTRRPDLSFTGYRLKRRAPVGCSAVSACCDSSLSLVTSSCSSVAQAGTATVDVAAAASAAVVAAVAAAAGAASVAFGPSASC